MDQHDLGLITMVVELDHNQRLATLRDARLPLPGVYEPLGWDHLAEGAPPVGHILWQGRDRGIWVVGSDPQAGRRTPAVPGHISGTVA